MIAAQVDTSLMLLVNRNLEASPISACYISVAYHSLAINSNLSGQIYG